MPTKPETETTGANLVEIRDLSVHFELRGGTLSRLLGRDTGTIKAVDGVNLALREGEVVGLVGESGSGKSTLGRALLGLVPATAGSIRRAAWSSPLVPACSPGSPTPTRSRWSPCWRTRST